MADYSVGVYNFDPYFTFSRTVGGSITYSGPTNSTGTATITDNGTGIEGASLEDNTRGETATVDITVGGNTSTGVDVSAEESWTVTNTTTGETFQMVTFHVESGPAAGYYTLSEQPLVVGNTYRTDAFSSNPDAGVDAVFSYDDYVSDTPDGTVDGSAVGDLINTSYNGDPQGEVVDGGDSVTNPGGNDDVIAAGGGDDTVFAGLANDTVFGGTGDDTIFGGAGADDQQGGDGDDLFVLQDGFGADDIDGGSGAETDGDTLNAGQVTEEMTVTFDGDGSGTLNDGTDTATFDNIEKVETGQFDDTIDASLDTTGVTLVGGGGDDDLTGGSGDDLIYGDDGTPTDTGAWLFEYYDLNPTGDPRTLSQAGFTEDDGRNHQDTATSIGYSDSITPTDYDTADDYALKFTTQISITTGGTYTFETSSDDGSKLYIDGEEVVDNDGHHGTQSQNGTVNLTAGTHIVEIVFYENNGANTLSASFSGPDTGNVFTNLTGYSGLSQVSGVGSDTINGGTGDDTMFGGGEDDTFILEDDFGNDTIFGGETGTDEDVIDASAMTSGIDITFTSNEAGTASGGTDTATFSQIEDIILTDHDDTVDASVVTNDRTFFGGAGDDSITSGSGDDTLYGGTGADTLNGGAGDDTLYGGADADTFILEDGFGDDTVVGGETSTDTDTLDASNLTSGVAVTFSANETGTLENNSDAVEFSQVETLVLTDEDDKVDATLTTSGVSISAGDGDDRIIGGSGADSLSGDDGNDSINAGGGNDTIYGGTGTDSLSGGDGNDTLFGGAGADILNLADGDTASGGDGDDTFILNQTDAGTGNITITGGEGNETNGDTLDFNGTLDKGTLVITDDDDANGGLTGYAFLLDGTRVDFTEIEKIICFARGTQILTHTGERAIEDLAAGDMVLTLDHGLQQIRWIGSRTVPATGDFAPITIDAGVLGNHTALTVSPQHRMLISGPTAELLFGEKEVLIPAKHLQSWDGIYRAQMAQIEYFHILFDTHQLIHANGAPSESFHPGEQALDAVTQDARDEILTLFPELADMPTAYGPAARVSLKGYEAEVLGRRMA